MLANPNRITLEKWGRCSKLPPAPTIVLLSTKPAPQMIVVTVSIAKPIRCCLDLLLSIVCFPCVVVVFDKKRQH